MAVAQRITAAAPAAIETLLRYGVRFDRTTTGALSLGLEAAHARRRIVHATGDGSTGRAIMRALSDAVRAIPSITVLVGLEARRLLVVDGAISGSGVLATSSSGTVLLPTGRVVIATGGLGGLFLHAPIRAAHSTRVSHWPCAPERYSSTWNSYSSTRPRWIRIPLR